MKYISKYLVKNGKLQESVFEVQDINTLDLLKNYLYSDGEFLALDKRGHQMYSTGFNHYYRFATGTDFSKVNKKIALLDVAMPAGTPQITATKVWKCSAILKNQVIESAGYQCEVNPRHMTFTAKSTMHPYMEGHHILPMGYQDKFDSSLDVYANIICLCPVCHRLLHYGVTSERSPVLNKIYTERASRLASSGIRISKSDFAQLLD